MANEPLARLAALLARPDVPMGALSYDVCVDDRASWRLDCTTTPPTIAAISDPDGDHAIHISTADLHTIVDRTGQANELPQLARRIRILAPSNELVCGIFYTLLEASGARGSIDSSDYDELAQLLPDPEFTLMNHGYAETDRDDFGWLRPEDQLWRYSVNLVRHTLGDVSLQDRRVLDVGCGRGGTCSYIARYHDAREVVGLDYAEGAVRACSEVHRFPNVRFIQGDAQALPFPDGRFDVVTNIESSHCYPDIKAFFAEVGRVLVAGGEFCYTDNSAFPATRFEPLFARAGLEVIHYREITDDVARAMQLGRPELERFLRARLDPAHDNESLVKRLLVGLHTMQRCYANRALLYHAWRLRKSPTSSQS